MPVNLDVFTKYLRDHAHTASIHKCAYYVRLALEAGGANTTGYPPSAKAYGPIMLQNGFHPITVEDPDTFPFLKGDVVVFQNYPSGNSNGHIAGFDGSRWISDFVQNNFWPSMAYKTAKATYVVYRW